MLGMSAYQLDLMFEYIECKSERFPTPGTYKRISEIRKTLLDEARASEENRQRIVKSLKHLGKPE
jgi:hypothetical protein